MAIGDFDLGALVDQSGAVRPRTAGSRAIARILADADERYIRAGFATLEQVCARRSETPDDLRRWMGEGLLPQPAYVLDDGTEMVPNDYLNLVDSAGGLDRLREDFSARYSTAAEAHGRPSDAAAIDEEYEAFLSGGYGVCLKKVTPENIALKGRLIELIEQLLFRARPDDAEWCARLRDCVESLDDLERPFAPLDDARWGDRSSRDRLITETRRRYPSIFSRPDAADHSFCL